MTHPEPIVGADLRSTDVHLVASLPDGSTRAWSVPTAAASVEGRLVYGQDAIEVLAEHPGDGWAGLLDRVGDPVPVALGDVRVTASDLVARALAATMPVTPGELRLIAPAGWGPRRREALDAALSANGLPSPLWIEAVDAIAPSPATVGDDPRALLLSIGDAGTIARVLSPAPAGWATDALVEVPFGADDIRDVTYQRVAAQIEASAGRRLSQREARSLAAVCAPAADRLPASHRLAVNVEALPTARVERAEIEDALAPRLAAAFGALPAALAAAGVADLPQRVLVEGPGAGVPVVARVLGEQLGRDVVPTPTEAAAAIASGAFAGAVTGQTAAAASVPVGSAPSSSDPTLPLRAMAPEDTAVLPYGWPQGSAPEEPAYADVAEAPRRSNWLKVLGTGLLLLAILLIIAALAGRAVVSALQGVARPTSPLVVPADTLSSAGDTPTLTIATPSSTTTPSTTTPRPSPSIQASPTALTASPVPSPVPGTSSSTTTSGSGSSGATTSTRPRTTKSTTTRTSTTTSTHTTSTTSTTTSTHTTSTTSTTTSTTTTAPPTSTTTAPPTSSTAPPPPSATSTSSP